MKWYPVMLQGTPVVLISWKSSLRSSTCRFLGLATGQRQIWPACVANYSWSIFTILNMWWSLSCWWFMYRSLLEIHQCLKKKYHHQICMSLALGVWSSTKLWCYITRAGCPTSTSAIVRLWDSPGGDGIIEQRWLKGWWCSQLPHFQPKCSPASHYSWLSLIIYQYQTVTKNVGAWSFSMMVSQC